MRPLLPFAIFLVLFLLVDLYAFKALKLVASGWQKPLWRQLAYGAYWVSTAAMYVYIALAIYKYNSGQKPSDYYLFFMGFGFLMLLFVPKLVVGTFHLVDDILHLFRTVATYFIPNHLPEKPAGEGLTRWQFLTRMGWILASIPFLGIIYGIGRGRYQFRVEKQKLSFAHLPAWAEGLRVVHISDIHIGSFFNNHKAVSEGIELINSLRPDVVLFTGDMVNNYAEELEGWQPVLERIESRYGKFSILGNHDYGDYANWQNAEAKKKNLERLKEYHKALGFRLLLNERVNFNPNGGAESIEIIGIENWGLGGFSQYGKLDQAMAGSNAKNFQVLLSHDPSHWDAEVHGKTSIDLTLAGHTHGMQFGVEIPGLIKWSPVKYRYPKWGGLYTEGKQHLYVNRGFGYIGFPGRVGMPPEITLLELSRG